MMHGQKNIKKFLYFGIGLRGFFFSLLLPEWLSSPPDLLLGHRALFLLASSSRGVMPTNRLILMATF